MEKLDLSTVPREDLEAFAADAMQRLESLGDNLQRLEEQLKVDPEVIDQWREWLATVDAEREKWAATSTRLSGELHDEKQHNARLFQHGKDLTVTLERIHDKAKRVSGEKTRTLDLKRAVGEIQQQASAAMVDAYEGFLGWPDEVDTSAPPPQLEEPETEAEETAT
jgi:DNA repair exonuclease SbcCD ATPase subunit